MSGDLNLFLVRHGETEGNLNRPLYKVVADHAVPLTKRGKEQSRKAGAFLTAWLRAEHDSAPEEFGKIRVWNSPYYRTRQTAWGIIHALGKAFGAESGLVTYREDPFLMEQKAGLFDGLTEQEFKRNYPDAADNYDRHCKYFGRTYGTPPLGEARMDVVLRVMHHFRTVIEDYQTRDIRHVVIVSHGVTCRAYAMRWMRYSPEWLDAEINPGNCWIRHIHGNRARGYRDEGYLYGDNASLLEPLATQKVRDNAQNVILLQPQRPTTIVPPGVVVVDPFKQELK